MINYIKNRPIGNILFIHISYVQIDYYFNFVSAYKEGRPSIPVLAGSCRGIGLIDQSHYLFIKLFIKFVILTVFLKLLQ
jgi:hypothetical protein